jgi:hypothetical protein
MALFENYLELQQLRAGAQKLKQEEELFPSTLGQQQLNLARSAFASKLEQEAYEKAKKEEMRRMGGGSGGRIGTNPNASYGSNLTPQEQLAREKGLKTQQFSELTAKKLGLIKEPPRNISERQYATMTGKLGEYEAQRGGGMRGGGGGGPDGGTMMGGEGFSQLRVTQGPNIGQGVPRIGENERLAREIELQKMRNELQTIPQMAALRQAQMGKMASMLGTTLPQQTNLSQYNWSSMGRIPQFPYQEKRLGSL